MKHSVILGMELEVALEHPKPLDLQGFIDLCSVLDIPMGDAIMVVSGPCSYDATRVIPSSYSGQIVSMLQLVRRQGELALTAGDLIRAWPFDREARLLGPNMRSLHYSKHTPFGCIQLVESGR